MIAPLTLGQYFTIAVVLIVLGRTIHYLTITRYLREHGIVIEAQSPIRDWKEWAAYRRARLSARESLTWWYVLWTMQIILLIWVVGWFFSGIAGWKIPATKLPPPELAGGGYVTVFDVTRRGYKEWSWPVFGLIFVIAGLMLPRLIRAGIFKKPPPWMAKWFPKFFVGFAVLWTVGTFIVTYTDYRTALDAMRNGRAQVVQGLVTQFRPMPYSGHVDESFVVQNFKFEYSDYGGTAGFNTTSSHGGPISEGLPVRIWHLGNEILRLDIAKPSQSDVPAHAR